MDEKKSKYSYILSMVIFGTVAIFSHYIKLSSGLIILSRTIIGTIVLIIFTFLIKREKVDFLAVKKNLLWLILSGMSLGLNWIFLFTAYNHTTVAIANTCNYLAPAIMILLFPLIFKEKLTIKKIVCVVVAFSGMIFVSGIIGEEHNTNYTGIILGILAALAYVSLVVFNKLIKDVNVFIKVMFELVMAFTVILPFAIFTTDFNMIKVTPTMIILLLVIGIIHTGLAYILYYGPLPKLSSQVISVFSYLEPLISIILSIVILKETMNVYIAIGIALILIATFISELNFKKKEKESSSA